jgi:putative transposase
MLYHSKNHRKYKLFCHLIFSTKYRKNLFCNNNLKQTLNIVLKKTQKDFKIIQQETDKNHIHFLIDYDPKISVTQIVRHLKQMTTAFLWNEHKNILKRSYWKERTLWADGYFVCSIGESNPETVKRYIENQG